MLCLAFAQIFGPLEVGVEISVGTIFETEDYVIFSLEGIVKIDQILMFYAEQDIFFILEHLYFFT